MPGVTSQLVRVLSPPRPVSTGTYTVTVSLHPDSLGAVQATVTASDERLSVRLVAGTSDGEAAIRQGLPELHEALAAGGQRTTVTVSGGGSSRSGPEQRPTSTSTGAGASGGGASGHQTSTAPPTRTFRLDTALGAATALAPAAVSGDGASGGHLVDVHV